jgi:hypothetical protein
MALLDVSELMWDPDFCDCFTWFRNTMLVNEKGRGEISSVENTAYGSVQPATERTYELFPDCARVRGALELFTNSALSPPTPTLAADTVIWERRRYVVLGVMDYGNFGNGYFICLIALQSLLAPNPETGINLQPPDEG